MLSKLGIVAAKRRGEWWARCPLGGHLENDASWKIRDNPNAPFHGVYYCFGCEQKGNAISLVSIRLGIDLTDAKKWLLANGLVLGRALEGVPEIRVVWRTSDRIRIPTELPATVRQTSLDRWPVSAQMYCDKRGISAEQVDRYRLGYAIHGRLACRIVFPAYNAKGELQCYTARSWIDSPVRYQTPLGSDGYSIDTAIFGEHLWPDLPSDVCHVTEGAINALAIERQVGSHVAVAGLNGSLLRVRQLLSLRRFSKLVLHEDGDAKGRSFTSKLGASFPDSDVISYPDGQDPASFSMLPN